MSQQPMPPEIQEIVDDLRSTANRKQLGHPDAVRMGKAAIAIQTLWDEAVQPFGVESFTRQQLCRMERQDRKSVV